MVGCHVEDLTRSEWAALGRAAAGGAQVGEKTKRYEDACQLVYSRGDDLVGVRCTTEWKGSYISELAAAKMLPNAARFPTVGINYTFYRMPTESW